MDYNISEYSKTGTKKYLYRQLFVNSGVWLMFMISGLVLGTPTVAIPQMRNEANSTEAVTTEMASWLSSVFGYTSIPWLLLLPALASSYGRRIPHFITAVTSAIAFVTSYFSSGPKGLLISQLIQGCTVASAMSVSLMIGTECSSPKYRGFFLTIKTASGYWGLWIANAIGTFFDYKIISLLGMYCCLHSFICTFWSESPYWLASKGRFEDCANQHRWLKGNSPEAESELKQLIESTKMYLEKSKTKESVRRNVMKYYFQLFILREFYFPTFLALLIMAVYQCSGKVVCNVYAIQIIKKITDNESTAYSSMLILDGFSIASMYFGSILSNYLKRRTLLLYSTWTGITFLFILALYTYLIKLNTIIENPYVTILLLAAFSIAISGGLVVLATSLLAELMPLRYKSIASCIAGMGGQILLSTMLKVAPYMFQGFGIHGSFLAYGLLCTPLLIIVQRYLPELKDKTLQEIENYFKSDGNVSDAEIQKLKD